MGLLGGRKKQMSNENKFCATTSWAPCAFRFRRRKSRRNRQRIATTTHFQNHVEISSFASTRKTISRRKDRDFNYRLDLPRSNFFPSGSVSFTLKISSKSTPAILPYDNTDCAPLAAFGPRFTLQERRKPDAGPRHARDKHSLSQIEKNSISPFKKSHFHAKNLISCSLNSSKWFDRFIL